MARWCAGLGVSACWCAAAGGLGSLVRCLGWRWGGLRKGLDRAAGSGGGLGSRAVAFGGRKILRSSVEGPRMLRLIRDPVANAGAFGLQRTKEESWVPLGVGWAALLPSRGTVHEKGEALPRLAPSAVDPPPGERSEGGRSTVQGATPQNLGSNAARSPRPRTSDRPAARSRSLRSAGRREAAPAQPTGEGSHTPTQPQVERHAARPSTSGHGVAFCPTAMRPIRWH